MSASRMGNALPYDFRPAIRRSSAFSREPRAFGKPRAAFALPDQATPREYAGQPKSPRTIPLERNSPAGGNRRGQQAGKERDKDAHERQEWKARKPSTEFPWDSHVLSLDMSVFALLQTIMIGS
jgi:hypothetical protein